MRKTAILLLIVSTTLFIVTATIAVADNADLAETTQATNAAPTYYSVPSPASITAESIVCPADASPATAMITDTMFVTTTADAAGEWEYGVPVTNTATLILDADCDFPGAAAAPPNPPVGPNVWATDLDGCYPPASASTPLSFDFNFPTSCDGGITLPPVELTFSYYYNAFTDFDEVYFLADGTTVYTDDAGPAGGVVTWTQATYNVAPNGNFTIDFQPSGVVQYAGLYFDFGGDAGALPAVAYCACPDATAVELNTAALDAPAQTSFVLPVFFATLAMLTLSALLVPKREA